MAADIKIGVVSVSIDDIILDKGASLLSISTNVTDLITNSLDEIKQLRKKAYNEMSVDILLEYIETIEDNLESAQEEIKKIN